MRPIAERSGHKPNSSCTVSRAASTTRALPVVRVRVTLGSFRASSFSHSRNANPSVATAAADRRYVNSFCLACAHVLTLCYTRTTRRTTSVICVRACNNGPRYHYTTLPSVTERLCRNGCARDAVRDTSTRGHGVPRELLPFPCLSFSLSSPPPLASSPSRPRAARFPPSLPCDLQAGRGPRTVRCFCSAAGRLRPHLLLLLTLLTLCPSSSLSHSLGSLSLYLSLRSAHARLLSVFRLVARSAEIGESRTPSFALARGDMTLAWLLPWQLATDAAGAWDSRSTLIRLHPVMISAKSLILSFFYIYC